MWENGKTGDRLEFERGRPGERGWKADDHWHHTPPGGDKSKHIEPGKTIKDARMDASPTLWDRVKAIPPRPIIEAGTAAIVTYLIISEGSRLFPPRNLIPVP
jgi:hypothetical protein